MNEYSPISTKTMQRSKSDKIDSVQENPNIKVSLNPPFEVFPHDRMFTCELTQTLLLTDKSSDRT